MLWSLANLGAFSTQGLALVSEPLRLTALPLAAGWLVPAEWLWAAVGTGAVVAGISVAWLLAQRGQFNTRPDFTCEPSTADEPLAV